MATQKTVNGTGTDWAVLVAGQQQTIKLGQYQRFAKLDALVFEYTQLSNPRMVELSKILTPKGRPSWPGINLDWLNSGPPLALSALTGEILIPANPCPLPPPAPDPSWEFSAGTPEPGRIAQRLEDRAMLIKGTKFLIVQPVIQIHWVLDQAAAGHARREIHNVGPDSAGRHMAFIYDPVAQTGHLVFGQIY